MLIKLTLSTSTAINPVTCTKGTIKTSGLKTMFVHEVTRVNDMMMIRVYVLPLLFCFVFVRWLFCSISWIPFSPTTGSFVFLVGRGRGTSLVFGSTVYKLSHELEIAPSLISLKPFALPSFYYLRPSPLGRLILFALFLCHLCKSKDLCGISLSNTRESR